MAEVQQQDSGGKKKGAQKKMTIRVDFTPMVDMNMLLITFFMLCTTMIKSQTLNIALPSNEKVQNEENMSQASADDAITIIIDAKRKPGSLIPDTVNGRVVNEIYYYDGKPCNGEAIPNAENNNLKKAEFVGSKDESKDIRRIIQDRNKDVWKKIVELKKKFQNGEITQEQFDEQAKAVRKDENLKKPVIIIKSTPEASYGALVEMLDEMQINSVSKYQIDNMSRMDSTMLIDFQNRNR
ncbi:MAG: biopolymer transporter ExbD [Muribaculaceae bacterium]|nr:biopolymer transporter ExbD [Muribaculaceae bacterium]